MADTDVDIWPIAEEAAALVEAGMTVGLGTGRAASMFVRALARRIGEGLDVRGVPTSRKTEELARELSVPLVPLDEVDRFDLDVDGADEVDPDLNLIKGHGGALVRERVVASVSDRFVILVGEEKLVPHLGAKRSVPVEVVPFVVSVTRRELEGFGAEVELRFSDGPSARLPAPVAVGRAVGVGPHGSDRSPFVTDNGNWILDVRLRKIPDPGELEREVDRIPGVVDNGIFAGMADLVLVQAGEETRRLTRR